MDNEAWRAEFGTVADNTLETAKAAAGADHKVSHKILEDQTAYILGHS